MTKNHTFRSFGDRIRSLKIAPNVRLGVRNYDYTTSSFLITSISHWKEINISGNFTSCINELEQLCRSLPQVIHHKEAIFDIFELYISKHDIHSLQPLLECLTQFVHDLGPDFLPFYARYVGLIKGLCTSVTPNDSQSMKNSVFVLEWSFNSLAFAFRYLSKQLTVDLWVTFEQFSPLLRQHKKAYIGRFCAEAISYLLRKSAVRAYEAFLDQLSMSLVNYEEERDFLDALVVLFSEACRTSGNSLHSKAASIVLPIIERLVISGELNQNLLFVLGKVMCNLLDHVDVDTGCNFSSKIIETLGQLVKGPASGCVIYTVLHVCSVLIFVDNGKKLKRESNFVNLTKEALSRCTIILQSEGEQRELLSIASFFISILVRNSDISISIPLFMQFWGLLRTTSSDTVLLSVLDMFSELPTEKHSALGIEKLLQQTISNLDSEQGILRLSFMMQRSDEKLLNRLSQASIPDELKNRVVDLVVVESQKAELSLPDFAWKCRLLHLNMAVSESDIKRVFAAAIALSSRCKSPQAGDVIGQLIGFCLRGAYLIKNESDLHLLCNTAKDGLRYYCGSPEYLKSLQGVVSFVDDLSLTFNSDLKSDLIDSCIKNLSSGDRSLRLVANEVLSIIDAKHLAFYSQLTILDQMPLEASISYDIKGRIKDLFSFVSRQEHHDQVIKGMSYYILGLLSNKFMPCWQAVYENLRQMTDAAMLEYLSSVLRDRIFTTNGSLSMEHIQETDVERELDEGYTSPSQLERLEECEGIFKGFYGKIRARLPSSYSELRQWSASYEESSKVLDGEVRLRAIKCFKEMPRLTGSNSRKVLDVVKKIFERDSDMEWRTDERIAALDVFATIRLPKWAELDTALKEGLFDALGSRNPSLQKAALNGYLASNPVANRYRDSLQNLLDDKVFKEELMTLVSPDSEGRIQDADEGEVIPPILHLLFGKIQSAGRKNSKANAKFNVASLLPYLHGRFIDQFLLHMSEKLPWEPFFNGVNDKSKAYDNTKVMAGFINMLSEVYDALGYKYGPHLSKTIKPLVFVLVSLQRCSDFTASDDTSSNIKSIRQSSFRCLTTFDKLIGPSFDWSETMPLLYDYVLRPRMKNFAAENAQQTSALLEFILNRVQNSGFVEFFKRDEWLPIRAVMSLLASKHAKEEVILCILDCFTSVLTTKGEEGDYHVFVAILVEGLLEALPFYLQESKSKELLTRCSTLLLLLVERKFLTQRTDKLTFIEASCYALQKSSYFIRNEDKASILISLALIVESLDLEPSHMKLLFRSCSGILRFSKDERMRNGACGILNSLSSRHAQYNQASRLLSLLNCYLSRDSHIPDVNKILDGFDYASTLRLSDFPEDSWMLSVATCLFYVDNAEESVLRLRSLGHLKAIFGNSSPNREETDETSLLQCFADFIKPAIKHGLSNPSDDVRNSYIDLLGFLVSSCQFITELQDMNCLLSDSDDDNFFINIQHLQITSRQKAIRGLVDYRSSLSCSTVEQYIIPTLENYLFCNDEKYRNLTDDSQRTFGAIAGCLPWQRFGGHLKKYISLCSSGKENIRDSVKVIVQLIQGFSALYTSTPNVTCHGGLMESDALDQFVVSRVIHPLKRILSTRDDATITSRLPLLEACVLALKTVSSEIISVELPGVLLGTCQVLRSKAQELRDAARKALCKACKHLGATYVQYVVRELKTALSRGSQIHVLSYTVNEILQEVSSTCKTGALDSCSTMLVDIIMEDIFGSAGKEKDSEGYHSKMREVKAKKSFDSIELLCSKLSFHKFDTVLNPVKSLLKHSLSVKTENALDEYFRRVCQGVIFNEKASSVEVLLLCYEIHRSSLTTPSTPFLRPSIKNEAHFLIDLKVKQESVDNNTQQYTSQLQRISFDILRAVIGKHSSLSEVRYMTGFIPLLAESFHLGDEKLTSSVLRIAIFMAKSDFGASNNEFFNDVLERSIQTVLESPSTKTDICQLSLRYVAAALTYQKRGACSDEAVRALLIKITPDLEDPENQNLAFKFVKAVIACRICSAEVYDLMDKILKIMVVNHYHEIRDMARSVYFKFMLQYNQSDKRLESSFKFLVANLSYPTPSGRQSVMELMHSIIIRSPAAIIEKVTLSFFVGLANVGVSDDSAKCRQMSVKLMEELLSKTPHQKADVVVKLIITWLLDTRKLLRRCGLVAYKVYLKCFGFGSKPSLDDAASEVMKHYLHNSDQKHSGEIEWEDLYIVLDLSIFVTSTYKTLPVKKSEEFWDLLSGCLLYPHAWVRLLSSKLISVFLDTQSFDDQSLHNKYLSVVVVKLMRQLAAPDITEELCNLTVSNIKRIFLMWDVNEVKYADLQLGELDDKEAENKLHYSFATEMLSSRCISLLRRNMSSHTGREARKAALDLTAIIASNLAVERLEPFALQFITILLGAADTSPLEDAALSECSNVCFKIAEEKLGISSFSKIVTEAKGAIHLKRAQRKATRAQLKLDAPDKAAERNQKKHARAREKRKSNKDENGYYKPKRRKL